MKKDKILSISALGFPWETKDPFLFCAYHKDHYPKANANMEPAVNINDRHLGNDFILKDGFRMYHGTKIPGFPYHPHRGFETVTVAKQGFVDHADSLGSSGRFSDGDVQWMTAGKGVQHSEMFPLLQEDKENPLEIFQIWLNLPKKNKMVDAHFKMLWSEDIPVVRHQDDNGNNSFIDIIAGAYLSQNAPNPAPNSWANDLDNEVAIWTIKMEANAEIKLPASKSNITRTLYFYEGSTIEIDKTTISSEHSIDLNSQEEISILNGNENAFILMLQGKPINEPVVQRGPFVMNTREEISETIRTYQETQFGGWPWKRADMVHNKNRGRFAEHANGKLETK